MFWPPQFALELQQSRNDSTDSKSGDGLDTASPSEQLLNLVRKPYAGPFEKRPVSSRVNSVANHDADLMDPVCPVTP